MPSLAYRYIYNLYPGNTKLDSLPKMIVGPHYTIIIIIITTIKYIKDMPAYNIPAST